MKLHAATLQSPCVLAGRRRVLVAPGQMAHTTTSCVAGSAAGEFRVPMSERAGLMGSGIPHGGLIVRAPLAVKRLDRALPFRPRPKAPKTPSVGAWAWPAADSPACRPYRPKGQASLAADPTPRARQGGVSSSAEIAATSTASRSADNASSIQFWTRLRSWWQGVGAGAENS